MTADDKPNGSETSNGQAPRKTPHLRVIGQYIKDLSLENPHAPQSMQALNKPPAVEIEMEVGTRQLGDRVFESVINFLGKATNDKKPLYTIELSYAGCFELENIPEESLQLVLLVNCPTLLYPFMRRIVADVTRDGGFPPLMLDPIDFMALYNQNVARSGKPAMPAA